MGLFGKKKDKKAEAAKVEKKDEPKPTAGSTIEFDADGKPIKAEWARSSKVELDEVETAIDLKARAESRQNVLKMYEEKYGEKLDAPEFSAGLQYEYQLYEDGTYSAKRDLKDVEKAAKAGTEGAAPTEGATKTEGAAPTEAGTKTEGTVEATGTKIEGTEPVKAQAPEKPAAPSFFDPANQIDWVKSGLLCIGVGKPLFPIARLVEYKARKRETWMKALIIVDILTIVEPLSWIWRVPGRIIYEILVWKKKNDAKKAEEEAKAKEAKEAKKAEKASKA
jgi:hypothetical protein